MTNFKKYLFLSLAVALLSAVIIVIFFVPRFNHTDSQQYVDTIKYVVGAPGGELTAPRILKPLPILIGAFVYPVLTPEQALIGQNLIFYFLSVWLIFLFIYRLYHNEKQAFYGTVLYIGAYPMLTYGLAVLTDISGWFFFLLSALVALNFLEKPQIKTVLLSGLVAGAGMLFKENTAAAPIFFVSLMFFAAKFSLKEKIKYIFIYSIPFIAIIIINSIFIYKFYSYSYLEWYTSQFNHPQNPGFFAYTPLRIVIEMLRVLIFGWIFVLLGIGKEFKLKNIERIKVLVAFIIPSLSFFLWSFPHNRIAYIAAPLLVALGSLGVLRNFKNYKINNFVEAALLTAYILINYAAVEFFLIYGTTIQQPGTLWG